MTDKKIELRELRVQGKLKEDAIGTYEDKLQVQFVVELPYRTAVAKYDVSFEVPGKACDCLPALLDSLKKSKSIELILDVDAADAAKGKVKYVRIDRCDYVVGSCKPI